MTKVSCHKISTENKPRGLSLDSSVVYSMVTSLKRINRIEKRDFTFQNNSGKFPSLSRHRLVGLQALLHLDIGQILGRYGSLNSTEQNLLVQGHNSRNYGENHSNNHWRKNQNLKGCVRSTTRPIPRNRKSTSNSWVYPANCKFVLDKADTRRFSITCLSKEQKKCHMDRRNGQPVTRSLLLKVMQSEVNGILGRF